PTPFSYDGSLDLEPARMRVALSLDFGFYALDPDVRQNTLKAAEAMRAAGVTVETVELDWSPAIIDVWMDYWRVFMAAYFGHCYDNDPSVLDPAVRHLIEQGRAMSAVEYKRLEIERTRFWQSF